MKPLKMFTVCLLGLSLLGAAAAEKEFDFQRLVKAQSAIKQTVSKVTFTREEMKEALWRSKIFYLDLSDVKTAIQDLMDEFKFKSVTFEGKNSPNLVSFKLDSEVSYPKLGKIPVIVEPSVGINRISVSEDKQELIVVVFGLKYDGQKIREFHWQRPQKRLFIVLENGQEVGLNTDEVKFFKKHEDHWETFKEKNDRKNQVPYQVAVDMFEFFERFATSSKDNVIQIPLSKGSVYYDEVQKNIARLAKDDDKAPAQIMANIQQVVITPEMIVVDFNEPKEFTTKRGYLKIDKQVKIKSRTKTAMVILGMYGANEEKEWFPVSNAILLEPNPKDFPYGAIRLTVRSLGPIGAKRPTHQYVELGERFEEIVE